MIIPFIILGVIIIASATKASAKPNTRKKMTSYEKTALTRYGQSFIDELKKVTTVLGFPYEWLLAMMNSESGINHKAYNPQGGATGLIQFMPDTAKWLGTTTTALMNMSAIQQLVYVQKYFEGLGLVGKIKSPQDLYVATFYPYALSQPDSYIIGSEVSPARVLLIAQVNKIFDINNNNAITKGEFKQFVSKKFKEIL